MLHSCQSAATFEIPVRGSSERVVLTEEHFVGPPDEILCLLENEITHLDTWLDVALECYRCGNSDAYLRILQSANGSDVEDVREYKYQRRARINICLSLAAFHTVQALQRVDSSQQESLFGIVDALIRKAELISAAPATPSNETTSHANHGHKEPGDADATDDEDCQAAIWISKGFQSLAQRNCLKGANESSQKLSKAASVFSFVSRLQPKNPYAKLGQAAVQFIMKNYRQALSLYADVLVSYPVTSPANIRYAIGLCFYHLGYYARAAAAFRRTLALDPNHLDTMTALAFILQDSPETCAESVSLIKSAAAIDPTDPAVLLLLANCAFLSERTSEASALLTQVNERYTTGTVGAHCRYQMGRLSHFEEDYQTAHAHYAACLRLMPNHHVARYGLAQCAVQLNQLNEALRQVQMLRTSAPNCIEVLKLTAFASHMSAATEADTTASVAATGSLGRQRPGIGDPTAAIGTDMGSQKAIGLTDSDKNRNLTLEIIDEALALNPRDTEALLLKAMIAEADVICGNVKNCDRTIESYKSLVRFSRDTADTDNTSDVNCDFMANDDDIPFEIPNTIAVIYLLDDSSEDNPRLSHEYFEVALNKVQSRLDAAELGRPLPLDQEVRLKCARLAIMFNIALQWEILNFSSKALYGYKKLLAEDPTFVSAWIRRARMSLERNDHQNALRYCDSALRHSPHSRDARVAQAAVYYSMKRHDKVLASLNKIIKRDGKRSERDGGGGSHDLASGGNALDSGLDSHTATFYAVVLYERAILEDSLTAETIARCIKYFGIALNLDPSNWIAANGVAVLLAEKRCSGPSQEIFRMISELATRTQQTRASHSVMEFASCINAGIMHAEASLYDIPNVRPGDDVKHADPLKIAKAIKLFKTAMQLSPTNRNAYLLMGRVCFEACQFRDCQKICEAALVRWPRDLRFIFNLALAVENATYRELRVDAFVKDPEKVRQWISECEMCSLIYKTLANLRTTWPNISQVNRAVLLRAQSGTDPVKMLGGALCSSACATAPPQFLELLPDCDKMKSLHERTAGTLLTKLEGVLPVVVKYWEKKEMELQSVREKNEALRKEHEEKLQARAQAAKEEEQRRLLLADQLTTEAAMLAGRIGIGARDGKERKGSARMSEFINDNDSDVSDNMVQPMSNEGGRTNRKRRRHSKSTSSRREKKKRRRRSTKDEDDAGDGDFRSDTSTALGDGGNRERGKRDKLYTDDAAGDKERDRGHKDEKGKRGKSRKSSSKRKRRRKGTDKETDGQAKHDDTDDGRKEKSKSKKRQKHGKSEDRKRRKRETDVGDDGKVEERQAGVDGIATERRSGSHRRGSSSQRKSVVVSAPSAEAEVLHPFIEAPPNGMHAALPSGTSMELPPNHNTTPLSSHSDMCVASGMNTASPIQHSSTTAINPTIPPLLNPVEGAEDILAGHYDNQQQPHLAVGNFSAQRQTMLQSNIDMVPDAVVGHHHHSHYGGHSPQHSVVGVDRSPLNPNTTSIVCMNEAFQYNSDTYGGDEHLQQPQQLLVPTTCPIPNSFAMSEMCAPSNPLTTATAAPVAVPSTVLSTGRLPTTSQPQILQTNYRPHHSPHYQCHSSGIDTIASLSESANHSHSHSPSHLHISSEAPHMEQQQHHGMLAGVQSHLPFDCTTAPPPGPPLTYDPHRGDIGAVRGHPSMYSQQPPQSDMSGDSVGYRHPVTAPTPASSSGRNVLPPHHQMTNNNNLHNPSDGWI